MKQIINDGKNDGRPPFYFLPDEDDYFLPFENSVS